MHEWQAVVVVGCAGGLLATGFPKGTDVAFDPLVSALIGSNRWASLLAHALLNTIAGGVAAFILWAGYSSSVTLASTKISATELGAALSTGLGGVSIVRNLIARAKDSAVWEETAKETADATESLDQSIDKPVARTDTDSSPGAIRRMNGQGEADEVGNRATHNSRSSGDY